MGMDKFDAVVVGAGPAGCAAAYTLAKTGLQVLVCERGKYAGAKNMWGGAFFGPQMCEIFPGFTKEAPVERFVNRHTITLLDREDGLTFDFRTPYSPGSAHGFITLRAKFDRWMAEKAEQAGAILATSLQADDLVREGNFIKGVKAGTEEFPADVVILAEGVNSLLTEKAGLRQPDAAQDMKQGVKEVIRLPGEILEERFQLQGEEGVAMEFLGSCTRGLPGGGFLYTNRDSVSLGLVVQLSALLEKRVKISELLEDFKKHPVIQPLIRKGELVEYSAHLIPVSGLKMMPRLFSDGVLVVGDAAALVLGTGLILEGANFAVASGVAAAKAVIQAKERGDFSRAALGQYERFLQDGGTLRDFQTFRRAPEFLENERIYAVYPQWACGLARKIFTSDGKPRRNTVRVLRESMKGRVTLGNLISDALKARKAI
jgi:electron transfer flavoprotein-quinone oxidoreductase